MKGVIRIQGNESKNDKVYNSDVVSFIMVNETYIPHVNVFLSYHDFNIGELRKLRSVRSSDYMEKLVKHKSFLYGLPVTYINDLLNRPTEAGIYECARSLENRNVYVIDSNDYRGDSIVLYQVVVRSTEPRNKTMYI